MTKDFYTLFHWSKIFKRSYIDRITRIRLPKTEALLKAFIWTLYLKMVFYRPKTLDRASKGRRLFKVFLDNRHLKGLLEIWENVHIWNTFKGSAIKRRQLRRLLRRADLSNISYGKAILKRCTDKKPLTGILQIKNLWLVFFRWRTLRKFLKSWYIDRRPPLKCIILEIRWLNGFQRLSLGVKNC